MKNTKGLAMECLAAGAMVIAAISGTGCALNIQVSTPVPGLRNDPVTAGNDGAGARLGKVSVGLRSIAPQRGAIAAAAPRVVFLGQAGPPPLASEDSGLPGPGSATAAAPDLGALRRAAATPYGAPPVVDTTSVPGHTILRDPGTGEIIAATAGSGVTNSTGGVPPDIDTTSRPGTLLLRDPGTGEIRGTIATVPASPAAPENGALDRPSSTPGQDLPGGIENGASYDQPEQVGLAEPPVPAAGAGQEFDPGPVDDFQVP
jgi:hypothetical protein